MSPASSAHDRAITPPAATLRAGRHVPSIILFVVITLVLLVADLVIKHYSFEHVAGEPVLLDPSQPDRPPIPPHDAITLVPSVLSLKLTTNTGAIFGLGKGAKWLFLGVTLAAVGVIAHTFARSSAKARWLHVALAMILSGALGNFYDRVMYNAVRDMFWLLPGVKLPFGLTWPGGIDDAYPWLFNLADAALVVGVGILLVMITFFADKPRPAAEKSPG